MTDDHETFTCADCGGTFVSDRPDEDAHKEAEGLWGQRGDAPGMVIVCDDCFNRIIGAVRS